MIVFVYSCQVEALEAIFNFSGSFSAFRSQSFLQNVSSLIERKYTQKRISAQVGLRIQHNFKFVIESNFVIP